VLEIVLRHATQAGATRVNQVSLAIGELASIVDDSVQFYWNIVAQGSLAEGALLTFRRIPAEMRCMDCQEHFSPPPDTFNCPTCAGIRIEILAGREFFVEAIDIETSTRHD
jgi:hydrogenase nickel incorporation protein HypA/HybF